MKIQIDLDGLEQWAEINRMKCNRDNCKALFFRGKNNQMQR